MHEERAPYYYNVGTLKFSLMAMFTFGFFEIYWSYRNWRYIKKRDQSKIIPVARAIFAPLWYGPLLKDLSGSDQAGMLENTGLRWLLVALYLALTVAGTRLGNPYWLISFFAFVALLPAVGCIQRTNQEDGVTGKHYRHNLWNYATYLLAFPIVVFLVFDSFGLVTSTQVIAGKDLRESELEILAEHGLLDPDEQVQYFYTLGVFNIEDDGQFITDRHVACYTRNNGELSVGRISYEEISSIATDWAPNAFEDSIVRVTSDDDLELELRLSSENGGDRRFVDELRLRWDRNRDSATENQ